MVVDSVVVDSSGGPSNVVVVCSLLVSSPSVAIMVWVDPYCGPIVETLAKLSWEMKLTCVIVFVTYLIFTQSR